MNTITHHQLRDKLRALAKMQDAAADFLEKSAALDYSYDCEQDHGGELRAAAKENLKLAGEGFHLITGNEPLPLPLWCVPRLHNTGNNEGRAIGGASLFVVAHDEAEALATAQSYLDKTNDNSRLGRPGQFATHRLGVIHDQSMNP